MFKLYTSYLPVYTSCMDWRVLHVCVAGILLVLLAGCAGTSSMERDNTRDKQEIIISDELKKMFEEGLELLKVGNYQAAVDAFKHIVEKEPNVAGPFVNLGIAYTELGQYQEAEQTLLQALQINAQHLVANNRLGLLYRRMGKFSEARLAYQRALKANSSYALAHLNLGILCDIYLQDIACAIHHFEEYQLLKPEESQQVAIWLADLKQRAPTNVNNEDEANR